MLGIENGKVALEGWGWGVRRLIENALIFFHFLDEFPKRQSINSNPISGLSENAFHYLKLLSGKSSEGKKSFFNHHTIIYTNLNFIFTLYTGITFILGETQMYILMKQCVRRICLGFI